VIAYVSSSADDGSGVCAKLLSNRGGPVNYARSLQPGIGEPAMLNTIELSLWGIRQYAPGKTR
jgi:hypothetical protein